MRFLHPEYLQLFYLLAALLPLWLYYFYTKRKTRLSLGASKPLRKISRLSSLGRDLSRYLLLNLAMTSLILALAHPQLIWERRVALPKTMDVVFLLDTSPSMGAEDIPPSRLQRAVEVIGDFARKKPPNDRLALVSFAGGSLILSYLTEDPDNILYYLDYLQHRTIPSQGTNIGRALQNGLHVMSKEWEVNPRSQEHTRVFILLSDGEDHGTELESAVQIVKGQGIKTHAIGVGSREGAPIPMVGKDGAVAYLEDKEGNLITSRFDEQTLRWIAEETGGSFYRSFTGHELGRIFAEIVLRERETVGFKRDEERENIYRGFLAAALGFVLAAILI